MRCLINIIAKVFIIKNKPCFYCLQNAGSLSVKPYGGKEFLMEPSLGKKKIKPFIFLIKKVNCDKMSAFVDNGRMSFTLTLV